MVGNYVMRSGRGHRGTVTLGAQIKVTAENTILFIDPLVLRGIPCTVGIHKTHAIFPAKVKYVLTILTHRYQA